MMNKSLELDLTKVPNIPIYMIAGLKDSVCTQQDINNLYAQIQGDGDNVTLVNIEDATHANLIYGPNLSHINDHVLPILK